MVSPRLPVEADNPLAFDKLGQVFVRRADYDALHGRIPAKLLRCGADGVVGFELHHGPDANAQRHHCPFRQIELGQQFRRGSLSGLVAWKQFVAEGRYHAVEGTADVRNPVFADEAQEALYQPVHRADGLPGGGFQRGQRKIGAEQFIGAINQVDFQMSFLLSSISATV